METAAADFRQFKEHYAKSMERMFAAVSNLYAEYWGEFFHFAIYEDGEENRESAYANTHRKYLQALRIEHASNVLELGCGRGSFSHLLAQQTEGKVLGIDISRAQLSHARRFRRPNLHFKHHDIMQVDELGETFDAVVSMDAACYLPDKGKAVQKIARVMKPGARLLLIDWCKQESLTRLQEELVLHPFMRYWAIPNLATGDFYRKSLERSGLKVLAINDLTSAVQKNWDLAYTLSLKAVKELSLRDAPRLLWKGIKLGAEGIRLAKEQFPAGVYIKVGFDAGFLRYMYFLAEKPSA